jgi:hypothetical protein
MTHLPSYYVVASIAKSLLIMPVNSNWLSYCSVRLGGLHWYSLSIGMLTSPLSPASGDINTGAHKIGNDVEGHKKITVFG